MGHIIKARGTDAHSHCQQLIISMEGPEIKIHGSEPESKLNDFLRLFSSLPPTFAIIQACTFCVILLTNKQTDQQTSESLTS